MGGIGLFTNNPFSQSFSHRVEPDDDRWTQICSLEPDESFWFSMYPTTKITLDDLAKSAMLFTHEQHQAVYNFNFVQHSYRKPHVLYLSRHLKSQSDAFVTEWSKPESGLRQEWSDLDHGDRDTCFLTLNNDNV